MDGSSLLDDVYVHCLGNIEAHSSYREILEIPLTETLYRARNEASLRTSIPIRNALFKGKINLCRKALHHNIASCLTMLIVAVQVVSFWARIGAISAARIVEYCMTLSAQHSEAPRQPICLSKLQIHLFTSLLFSQFVTEIDDSRQSHLPVSRRSTPWVDPTQFCEAEYFRNEPKSTLM